MTGLSMHSPLGPITLTEQEGTIIALDWRWTPETAETGLLRLAREQLDEYFDGRRARFVLPLAPGGTRFQRSVWSHMLTIPYGSTRSYGEAARALGSGARAVGTACARNPIPILIPCHRVVGRGGALTGYSGAGGLDSKRFLLDLERAAKPRA